MRILATLLLTAGAASADVLPEYMWEKRPIVVIGAEDDPRVARQMALFEAETAELAERRNIVLRRMPDGPLAEALGAETFGVFLIGLDGGVKFRSSDVTPPDDLHALVDAMPMRREELRRRSP